jgi:hypothetical protein
MGNMIASNKATINASPSELPKLNNNKLRGIDRLLRASQ